MGFFYAPRSGGLTNTMLDARKHVLTPSRGAFMVSEGKQGGTDLNGDGEASTQVLHVFHARDGSVVNTGARAHPLGFTEAVLIAMMFEFAIEVDLNGDRDVNDIVLYPLVLDGYTGETAGIAVRTTADAVEDRWAAFSTYEVSQGFADLNGDGDVQDHVLHLFDSATGALINLGFAVPRKSVSARDGLVVFAVDEDANGGIDLNGNGSGLDDVFHVHDTETGRTINLGFGTDAQIDGRYLAYTVDEAALGADLNRDGDEEDATLHVFDRRTESVRNLGWAVSGGRHRLGGRHLVALVEESGQGAGDLNGNGSVSDDVYHLHRLADGARVNLGLAGDSSISASNMAAFTRGHVMLLVSEAGEGEDLNGDGDTLDRVPSVVSL